MPHRHLLAKEKREAIEPCYVPDTYCDHLHSTELIAPGLFRFVFTVEQRCSFTGHVEHVIAAKLVVPEDVAKANSRNAAKGMGVTAERWFGG